MAVLGRFTARRSALTMAVAVVAATLLFLSTAVLAAEELETTSFYGILELPKDYFTHPDCEAEINRIQPGYVSLHNSHGTITVPVQKDGAFTFYNLPYGTYMLVTDFHDFTFPSVRVEVQYKERTAVVEGDQPIRVPVIRSSTNDYPVKPLRGSGVDEDSPATIPAMGMHEYYVPREQFQLTDLLKNPMILMMLVSFGLMGMMKLFPEEEMKESQKMSRDWQRKLINRATGIEGDDADAAPASIEKKKK